jgi:hypothetical protein
MRLSREELERDGHIWGAGRERRALCPFCGDRHCADRAHASLAVNVETGAWHCHRCQAAGLLEEFKEHHDHDIQERARRRCRRRSRAWPHVQAPRVPSPAERAEQTGKREALRRLWTHAAPIDKPAGRLGADYLWARGIPLLVALEARVRFSTDWFGRPAVLFPVQNGLGRLVAGESRYIDGNSDPKSRSVGSKRQGVFVASPGALDADGVAIAEGPITALSLAACGMPALALCGHASAHGWLVRHLAVRHVYLARDYGEAGAEEAATRLVRDLTAMGAKPHRLALPAGVGDWNDWLVTVGIAAMRNALAQLCAQHA